MLIINAKPYPILETNRLILRPVSLDDTQMLFKIRSNEVINKYLDRVKPLSLQQIEKFIKKINNYMDNGEWLFWVICLKTNSELIGTICFWNIIKEFDFSEIGYELLPEFFNQGYMQEALSEVLDYGFDILNFHLIEAWTHSENKPSIKLLENNLFARDPDLEEKHKGSKELNNYIIFSRRKK